MTITIESPAKLEQILWFNAGKAAEFEMPDSLASLTVDCAAEGGFVCRFGADSQLRKLSMTYPWPRTWIHGFMRMSEPLLKRMRSLREWCSS
jgi:hypothetical protein